MRVLVLVCVLFGAWAHAQVSSAEIEVILAKHNQERALVCVSPLTWSASVANVAQNWANQCTNSHSTSNYGENIASGTFSYYDVGDLVDLWISEKQGYVCKNSFDYNAGHYTQMVWKGTTQVGCGVKNCNGNRYLVCNYNPAGNVMGQYPWTCGASCSSSTTASAPVTTGQFSTTAPTPGPVTTGTPSRVTTGGSSADLGNCRKPRSTTRCSNECISQCVCDKDNWCCRYNWDLYCCSEVSSFGCAAECGVVIPQDDIVNTTNYVRDTEMSTGYSVPLSLAVFMAAWAGLAALLF